MAKRLLVLVIWLTLVMFLAAGCKSSPATVAGGGVPATSTASASTAPTACPSEAPGFAKTKFAAHVVLGFGAFHRYIYKPQARGPLDQLAVADLRACLEVNVVGTWLACRAAAAPMRAAGYGRILTMASALGLAGAAARSGYAASTGAVVQLTRSRAAGLAGTGITVNALAPARSAPR